MDYGNAVSQKGYDVKTCADRFLVYSSAFQTLKIAAVFSVSTTIPASGSNYITIDISSYVSGYSPFFVIYNGSSTIGVNNSYHECDSGGNDIWAKHLEDDIQIEVYETFDQAASSAGDTVYFTVYLFVDDFVTVSQQNINTGTSSGASSSNYGIRVSKAGYDVKTCADKDCVLSSSFFSSIVHKKGEEFVSADMSVTVNHNLGYVPAAFAWYRYAGGDMESAYFTINSSSMTIIGAAGGVDNYFYYVIFKNKLE